MVAAHFMISGAFYFICWKGTFFKRKGIKLDHVLWFPFPIAAFVSSATNMCVRLVFCSANISQDKRWSSSHSKPHRKIHVRVPLYETGVAYCASSLFTTL
ncbi:unnamed protein product [Cuscuta epithymum]|uniref:Uncharacterized protein n=1 Tax=Cuscuta epithymum TaxID=186058 RepID=A0AAV0DW49_9ASTE|nr:unnamed protein product [Cuscuta epithymum]